MLTLKTKLIGNTREDLLILLDVIKNEVSKGITFGNGVNVDTKEEWDLTVAGSESVVPTFLDEHIKENPTSLIDLFSTIQTEGEPKIVFSRRIREFAYKDSTTLNDDYIILESTYVPSKQELKDNTIETIEKVIAGVNFEEFAKKHPQEADYFAEDAEII